MTSSSDYRYLVLDVSLYYFSMTTNLVWWLFYCHPYFVFNLKIFFHTCIIIHIHNIVSRPISSFSVLNAEKREGVVREVTCITLHVSFLMNVGDHCQRVRCDSMIMTGHSHRNCCRLSQTTSGLWGWLGTLTDYHISNVGLDDLAHLQTLQHQQWWSRWLGTP